MSKQEFLKKWLPVVEHGLKVSKNTFKIDLELLFMSENQALQNVIDRQAEDLRCFENQGHNWGEEMIRTMNPIPVGDSRRTDKRPIPPSVDGHIFLRPGKPLLIVDCDYPPEQLKGPDNPISISDKEYRQPI